MPGSTPPWSRMYCATPAWRQVTLNGATSAITLDAPYSMTTSATTCTARSHGSGCGRATATAKLAQISASARYDHTGSAVASPRSPTSALRTLESDAIQTARATTAAAAGATRRTSGSASGLVAGASTAVASV